MVSLKVGNSYSQLFGLSVEDYRGLKKLLSYTVNRQAAYMGGRGRPQRKSLLSKKLEFPTGLLYVVEEYLKSVAHRVDDTRVCPITPLDAPSTLFLPQTTLIPYLEQIEATEALMSCGGRGIVVSPTGSGKSLMIALTIDKFKVKTLVVVPSLEIKRQLSANILQWFGRENYDRFVEVANVDSLDTSRVLKDVGMVICDEFHHSAAKTYRDLNKKAWVNVYHRVGYTATPFRSSDDERLLLESFLSHVVYRLDYAKAVAKGYVVPAEAYYFQVPKTALKGNPSSYPAMYSECIVNNDYRNNVIAVLLARLHSQGKSTLCLVKEIRHGEILSEKTYFPFANGQDGQSQELIRAFNSGQIKTLLGTTGVLGEGVDTKPAEYVVIAGAGKSPVQFAQQIGRGFRNYQDKKSCKIILFEDKQHKWFLSHFKNQCKILRDEYSVEPIRLEI